MNAESWGALSLALGSVGGIVRWAVGRWEAGQKIVADQLFETRVLISALQVRDRNRDVNERRRRESEQPPTRKTPTAIPIAVPVETTDVVTLMDEQRIELTKQDEIRRAKVAKRNRDR